MLNRYVPAALTDRPKMGFGIPVSEWLTGPLREWAENLLAPRRLRDAGHFDTVRVRRLWDQHVSGYRDRYALLWSLLAFQSWLEAREARA